MHDMRTMIPLLTISLFVAIAGCLQPAFLAWPDNAVGMALRSFGPLVVWVLLFVIGLITYGRSGLWLLVGAPLALFPALTWSVYVLGCTLGRASC